MVVTELLSKLSPAVAWVRANAIWFVVTAILGLIALWQHAEVKASHADEYKRIAAANAAAINTLVEQQKADLALVKERADFRAAIYSQRDLALQEIQHVQPEDRQLLSPASRALLDRVRGASR